VLLSILVVAFIFGSVWPCLNTVTVLFVLLPVTNILSSIDMLISSSSMSLVVKPLALITVTISVDQASQPISLVILPVALVLATILPNLDALAFSEAIFGPLTVVNSTIIEFVWPSGNKILISWRVDLVEDEWSKSLFGLTGSSIRMIWHFS